MSLTLKQRILFLVGIVALASLAGYFLLIRHARDFAQGLQDQTVAAARQLVQMRAAEIDSTMAMMEKKALDLASAGEAFYALRKRVSRDVTPEIRQYLVATFTRFPEAIGGGIWYQPFRFLPERRYYGPYVAWKSDRVEFTWDLSTPEYDYLNQDWYRTAIPAGWDERQRRPQAVYWTEPYFDDAGTKSLMMTVDALMYDEEGRILGVSTLDLSLEHLRDMVEEMKLCSGSYAFAVDTKSDRFVAFPADRSKVLKKTSTVPWADRIRNAGHATREVFDEVVKVDGKDYALFHTTSSAGMILGIMAPYDQLYASILALNRDSLYLPATIIVFEILLVILISSILVRRIGRPVSELTGIAQQMAVGDLVGSSSALGRLRKKLGSSLDEIGRLVNAFSTMIGHLSSLVGQMRESGVTVTSSSTEIAASARELEASVAEQAASAREVTGSTREIAATAEKLAQKVDRVGETVSQSASMAEAGRADLVEMEEAMNGLIQATASVSSRLAVINERTARISDVSAAIDRVSERTNLLSLNAAIEAEKAGEFGKGFSVVAREISRLSDQTALATRNIAEMVQEMQSSVTSGVTEMDRFTEEVRKRVTEVSSLGTKLSSIIESVRVLAPEFEAIKNDTRSQTQAAQQIAEAMNQLSVVTDQTRQSLVEFKETAERLNQAVQGQQAEVGRFRLPS